MSSTGVLVSRIRWANCEEYTTVRAVNPPRRNAAPTAEAQPQKRFLRHIAA